MSYFDNQEDAWFANDCKGNIEDYTGEEVFADAPRHAPPANKVRTTAHGRRRDLLALSKLEEFAAWSIADGFAREPTKGDYEVLRLRWTDTITGKKMQPYIFYKRDGAMHATSQAEGTQLVARWLRTRERTKP